MTVAIVPGGIERLADVATMLGPKNPSSTVGWCLTYLLDSRTNRSLWGSARGDYMRALTVDRGRAVRSGVRPRRRRHAEPVTRAARESW